MFGSGGNLLGSASIKYLFDKYCTGRLNYSIGTKKTPQLLWKFETRAYPVAGVESTPCFDHKGNIYFGSHDGCIYSVNPVGELRWMFKTNNKVYSSPYFFDNQYVLVGCGDGFLRNFNLDGRLFWSYDISQGYRSLRNPGVFAERVINKYFTHIMNARLLWNTYCWSSPNVDEDIVYITGYGTGLHAIHIPSGKLVWKFALQGTLKHHLAGVSIDNAGNIYTCSQQGHIYCIKRSGEMLWTAKLQKGYDTWGSPSIDPESGLVYVNASRNESHTIMYCFKPNGKLLWKRSIETAVRGSAAISYENYIVFCGFNGHVYFLDKRQGSVIYNNKLSSAERALWTTPSIDPSGRILFTSKDSNMEGSIICLGKNGDEIWRIKDFGKSLSTPVVDREGYLYAGSWKGNLSCYMT